MPEPHQKIFVLDTSVILHDFNALQNFQEHDVAIPITVLEELDQFKKGNSVLNLQAREFIRQLDKLSDHNMLHEWIPLDGPAHGKFRRPDQRGRRHRRQRGLRRPQGRPPHPQRRPQPVALGPRQAGDPGQQGHQPPPQGACLEPPRRGLRDGQDQGISSHLPKGKAEVEVADGLAIDRLYQDEWLPVDAVLAERPAPNQYYILRSGSKSALAYYNSRRTDRIERVVKSLSYGISPRNAEQTFALHAVLNPDVLLVTLFGAAGTGKTLRLRWPAPWSSAGASTRSTWRGRSCRCPTATSASSPGDIQSKIKPQLRSRSGTTWGSSRTSSTRRSRSTRRSTRWSRPRSLHIVLLAYIRGRSLSNVIFIVDEAQNLTPRGQDDHHPRRRAHQDHLDRGHLPDRHPYLDASSNGLSYRIDRVRGNPLYAHVNLEKGERSALANLASSML